METYGNGSIDPFCTEVIVVRHGETDWNAIGKMQVDFFLNLLCFIMEYYVCSGVFGCRLVASLSQSSSASYIVKPSHCY